MRVLSPKRWTEEELQLVLEAIPWGEENKIIADEIAAFTGIPDEPRTQARHREAIRILRKRGWPIVSNSRGFWLTHYEDELREYLNSLTKRIKGIEATRDSMICAIGLKGIK